MNIYRWKAYPGAVAAMASAVIIGLTLSGCGRNNTSSAPTAPPPGSAQPMPPAAQAQMQAAQQADAARRAAEAAKQQPK
jgi:hypothetical protein